MKYANYLKKLLKKNLPLFGICLGHQILALTLGGKTKKMKLGHRGANHPVKNLIHDNVEITSQNHGFEIIKETLPKNIEITHKSLFDNCIEGIRLKNKPIFSVQYHPESNPGPLDKKIPFGFNLRMSFALVLHETTVTLQLRSEKYLRIFFLIP